MRGIAGKIIVMAMLVMSPASFAALNVPEFMARLEQSPALVEMQRSLRMAEGDPQRRRVAQQLKRRIRAEENRLRKSLQEVRALAHVALKKNNINVQDAKGKTLMMHVAAIGHEECIHELMSMNSDLSVRDKSGKTAFYYDKEYGGGILADYVSQMLVQALDAQDSSALKRVCAMGLEPDFAMSEGPLVGVLLRKEQCELLEDICYGRKLENISMRDGVRLSELFVRNGDSAVMAVGQKLLGKALWEPFVDGTLPLVYLLSRGSLEAVKACVAGSGSNYVVEGRVMGGSVAAAAVRYAKPEVVRWVLGHADVVNREDDAGRLPLLEAARRGNEEVYAVVLASGAKLEQRNERGETVLMHAALSGNEALVAKLVSELPAELLKAVDADGRSAVYYARLAQSRAIENMLLAKGVAASDKDQVNP